MTLRIEPFFQKKMTRRIDFLKNINQIKETFCWLKELNVSFTKKKTHRTEPIFSYDTLNWTLLSNMTHKNWTLLFYMTQRIEPIFQMTQRIEYDSKNWMNLSNMTQKSFFFWTWFTELNLFSALLIEWNIWEYDSKNWTFFDLTQRIEPSVLHDPKNWTFFFFFENLCFLKKSQIWTLFNMTQRIEPDFQNLTKKKMNPLHKRTQRIGPEKICLTPTTKLFYDSRNWTFKDGSKILKNFEIWLKDFEPLIEFFWQHDSKNWTLFLIRLKELNTF